jgi:hypothetical protein
MGDAAVCGSMEARPDDTDHISADVRAAADSRAGHGMRGRGRPDITGPDVRYGGAYRISVRAIRGAHRSPVRTARHSAADNRRT